MGAFNNELYFQAHVDSLQIARTKAGVSKVDIFLIFFCADSHNK